MRAAILGMMLASVASAAVADEAADRLLFNRYESLCSETKGGGEEKLLNCRTLRNQPAIVQKLVHKQVSGICKEISRQCEAASDGDYRNRLVYFSVSLGCTRHSDGCPMHEEKPQVRNLAGDINLVVEAIEAIEKAGARVHPGLKLAVGAYVEASDLGEDLQESAKLVSSELGKFYANAELGCLEDPDFADDPPPNACTAKIDRRWQMNSLNAVLNWQNEHSVIRDTTRRALRRWDLDRLRRLAKP
jgi:hypothetical protein